MSVLSGCNLPAPKYLKYKINWGFWGFVFLVFFQNSVSCHIVVGLQILPELYLQDKSSGIALGLSLYGFSNRK